MTTTNTEPPYAESRHVDSLDDCIFYHACDIPGIGEIKADWDLRACIDAYLGNFDFTGKRVLDVGTASGYLTFEMEKRGADVLSFDMASGRQWDCVPFATMTPEWDALLDRLEKSDQKLKNSYWLAHRLLASKARAYYGNIYEPLPETVGDIDVAVFGMIITHLRDPFGAFCAMLPRVRETVIVTSQFLPGDQRSALFAPSIENQQIHAFWVPTRNCVAEMLRIHGFELDRMVPSFPHCSVEGYQNGECTAIVASRR
jgi:hypothetical protein